MCVSYQGGTVGEREVGQLAVVRPVGIRFGANSLYCDSWDLSAKQGPILTHTQGVTQDWMGGQDVVSGEPATGWKLSSFTQC